MCMLCGDTKEQGRKQAIYLAERLEAFAGMQRALASGRLDPHGGESSSLSILSHGLIRELVREYL